MQADLTHFEINAALWCYIAFIQIKLTLFQFQFLKHVACAHDADKLMQHYVNQVGEGAHKTQMNEVKEHHTYMKDVSQDNLL